MTDITIALTGNPNCGKTTLFNALTGSKQRVGNWSGVTVEKKVGQFSFQESSTSNSRSNPSLKQASIPESVNVVDLPGTYNLTTLSDTISLDERIACDYILSRQACLVVNVIDASNLERNLYLTTQLIEMGTPVIIALNMMDVARERGLDIDIQKLSKKLQCPIVPLERKKEEGIKKLKEVILKSISQSLSASTVRPDYPKAIKNAQNIVAEAIDHALPEEKNLSSLLALRLLEDDCFAKSHVNDSILKIALDQQSKIQDAMGDDSDILIADARYGFVNQLTKGVVNSQGGKRRNLTKIIDNIVLNRFFAIPFFLFVMYALFFFSINIGGAFQDFFDIGSNTIFVHGLASVLNGWGVSSWLTAVIANGFGKGINTTLTFIPIIGAMFLFLSFLEDSGYMARAAFVMDRLMRAIGLPGKAFVPMIVGFGCNVPAVMATRTLENRGDRIITVMMAPFMSCGARLAIFAVFTAAFFPQGGEDIVFLLYLTGILIAILTGLILRKTLLQGDPSPMVMELPPYHLPQFKTLLRSAWGRLKNFLFKAGKVIIPISILIGALNAMTIPSGLSGLLASHVGHPQTLLSIIGRFITPIFAPLGLQQNNWPATVGLLTGVLAKEVVIATLNTLYAQAGHLSVIAGHFHFWAGIQAAFQSIPDNLKNLSNAFGNPVLASAPDHFTNEGVLGVMYQRFQGQTGALAYLLFVLLYLPCVSVVAVTSRELGRNWALFSVLWNTSLAYGAAVIFYQVATFTRHPLATLLWVAAISLYFVLIFRGLRYYANRSERSEKGVLNGQVTLQEVGKTGGEI